MRKLFPIIFLCVSAHGYGQESSKAIEDSIITLEAKKKEYQNALAAIPSQILALEERLPVVRRNENIAELNEKIGKGISVILSEKSNMTTSYGNENGTVLYAIPKEGIVVILNADHFPYYQVRYKGKTGYIPEWALSLAFTTIESANSKAAMGVSTPKNVPTTLPPTTSNYSPSLFTPSTFTPSTERTTNCNSAQCSGSTNKGARCRNMTTNCNGRCHYH